MGTKNLEDIVESTKNKMKGEKKYMIIGDIHAPFEDKNAMNIAYQYTDYYKPNEVIINGDLIDFYNISRFDKNPSRKEDLKKELTRSREILDEIRQHNPEAKITLLEGNHDFRLQSFIWRNPEFEGVEEFSLKNLLHLDKYNINFIGVDGDYWKNDNGHYKVNDLLIMHGDNRLNGAKTSQNGGYSAINTMKSLQHSVAINHIHRLAQVHHTTPYGELVGLECGSLCQPTGTANWQQGFVTFESYRNKNHNYRTHLIQNKKLIEDGMIFKG